MSWAIEVLGVESLPSWSADGADYGRFTDASRQTLVEDVNLFVEDVEEESKWKDGSQERGKEPIKVSIERHLTTGGGSLAIQWFWPDRELSWPRVAIEHIE